MSENTTTTQNGTGATTTPDDYPRECDHGVPLRFFAEPDDRACFECWSARSEQ